MTAGIAIPGFTDLVPADNVHVVPETRWVRGDHCAIDIPADSEALGTGGTAFLTDAFHRFGALPAAHHVTAITQFEECAGGSTGRKLLLAVEYSTPQTDVPADLFVKFSRDFDNPRRDRGKSQMDLEVQFAHLSRRDDFPVVVPTTLFADYHRESGTGILITDRIPFGIAPVEPHYDKCLDYLMPDPLGHYEALLTSVARLAAAHKSGALGPGVSAEFAYDPAKVTVGQRVPSTPELLRQRIDRYEDFSQSFPTLLPENIRSTAFVDRMRADAHRIAENEAMVLDHLNGAADHVALCHWNANVDNAWFWRDADGRLDCGLLDWGCVSVMNVAMVLWGALCSAESELLDGHLDHLLGHFADEYGRAGGPAVDTDVLRRQLMLYAAVMGVTWLLDAPAYIQAVVPDLADVADRFDVRISGSEVARTQLRMLTNFLHLWETEHFGTLLS